MDFQSTGQQVKHVRHDMWTEEADRRLVDIVLSAIQSGETQLSAFEQAGRQLGRTASACGFRWNGQLRHHHKTQIEQAKQERRVRMQSRRTPQIAPAPFGVTSFTAMQEALNFLRRSDGSYQEMAHDLQSLLDECDRLRARLSELEEQSKSDSFSASIGSPEQTQEDAKHLVDIMLRARKLLGRERV